MLPTLKVEIDFSTGATFGYPLILDSLSYGILGLNVLADGPLDIVDITSQVRKVSTRRGRNRLLAQFEAGTATVTLNDPNGDFNPQNSSSPYWDPVTNSTKAVPLRKIRIYAETPDGAGTLTIPLFAGYITSYDTSFYKGTNEDSTVILQCVDAFRLLANVATGNSPVPGTSAGQYSGFRTDSLLQFAGFPDSMMQLDGGQSQMQADPGGNRSILQAIQTVEQSEFGGFFVSRTGKATFLDRDTISKRANSVPREYSDVYPLPANTYPYTLIDFAFDDQLILNKVTAQAVGGPAYTEQDNDSIAKYFIKSGQRLDLLLQNTEEAQDQALTILASRKDAELRVNSMTININDPISEQNTIANLSMDIYTLITATKTMPGNSTITKELFVQGVNHDITPNAWTMTLYTAEPIIQAFILDSDDDPPREGQGILDENALSY